MLPGQVNAGGSPSRNWSCIGSPPHHPLSPGLGGGTGPMSLVQDMPGSCPPFPHWLSWPMRRWLKLEESEQSNALSAAGARGCVLGPWLGVEPHGNIFLLVLAGGKVDFSCIPTSGALLKSRGRGGRAELLFPPLDPGMGMCWSQPGGGVTGWEPLFHPALDGKGWGSRRACLDDLGA